MGIAAKPPYVTCNGTSQEIEMSAPTQPRSTRDRVEGHRERLRRQGLRPIQIWVPDTRSPAFAAEAHRQSAAVAASRHEPRDQAFIDAISGDEDR
jgi:DNA-binding LacI/PurR family transcriptional regulator